MIFLMIIIFDIYNFQNIKQFRTSQNSISCLKNKRNIRNSVYLLTPLYISQVSLRDKDKVFIILFIAGPPQPTPLAPWPV